MACANGLLLNRTIPDLIPRFAVRTKDGGNYTTLLEESSFGGQLDRHAHQVSASTHLTSRNFRLGKCGVLRSAPLGPQILGQ